MSPHRETAPVEEGVDDFTSALNSCLVDAPTVNRYEMHQHTFIDPIEELDRACDVFGGWTDYVYGPREEIVNASPDDISAHNQSVPTQEPDNALPARSPIAAPATMGYLTHPPAVIAGARPTIQQRSQVHIPNIPATPDPSESSSPTSHNGGDLCLYTFARAQSPELSVGHDRLSPLRTATPVGFRTSSHWHQGQAKVQAPGVFGANRQLGQCRACNMRSTEQLTSLPTTGAYPMASIQTGRGIASNGHIVHPHTSLPASAPYFTPTSPSQASQGTLSSSTITEGGSPRQKQPIATRDFTPTYTYQFPALEQQANPVNTATTKPYAPAQTLGPQGTHIRSIARHPNSRRVVGPAPSCAPDFSLPLDQRPIPDYLELIQSNLIQIHELRLPQYSWMDRTMPQFKAQAMDNFERHGARNCEGLCPEAGSGTAREAAEAARTRVTGVKGVANAAAVYATGATMAPKKWIMPAHEVGYALVDSCGLECGREVSM
ncbi:uncharacterized protein EI97DRAFT_486892 [Westerdykella ornata]|uniref:Uncharacterized protein n=1 Tax=Westerdykella ornata TaxID=318751 RepID=A0A6A6J6Z7_WESOR|nr:uncharacterized protein EI97DRAFT_486892 [Westerdykella ornata]KAF2271768.1 hypothetical protein EI97DRAFT_486892 [Westerdykella ornata]